MIEFKRQLITPAIAKAYLEANVSNRRLRSPTLLQYVKDMANGRWKEETGEVIKISKTGRILDGQHRLWAIVKANVSLYFHVAINLEDEVFDVLDTGRSRNSADAFKIMGIKNDSSIPSMIAMYNFLLLGRRAGIQKNEKSTNAMLLEQYYLDENFWQNVVKQSHSWYSSFAKILPTSVLGGFYAFFLKLNEEKAEPFLTQLTTGIGISNDTIMLLRNKLIQDKMAARKMPPTLKYALIIKAWNFYVKGDTVKLLKFDSMRDEFPIAVSGY